MLFKFGTDCSCSESLLGGDGAFGTIAEALGFEAVEDYIEWRDSLSPEELAEHLAEIAEILGG